MAAVGYAYVPFGGTPSNTQLLQAYLDGIGQTSFINIYGEAAWNNINSYIINGTVDANWQTIISTQSIGNSPIGNTTLGDQISSTVVTVNTLFYGSFFQIDLIGYQAQVFTILLVVAFSVNFEKLLNKITPSSIQLIVVPFFTLIITA